jgi:hypothetical protein
VCLDELAAEVEPEPGSGRRRLLSRRRRSGKDILHSVLLDPDALVGDGDDDGPIAGRRRDRDGPLVGELDGVLHEVAEDVAQPVRIRPQAQLLRDVDFDPLGSALPAVSLDRTIDYRLRVHGRGIELEAAGLQPRQVEDLRHDPAHPFRVRVDRLDELQPLLVGEPVPALEERR